jgi:hypothetical protein
MRWAWDAIGSALMVLNPRPHIIQELHFLAAISGRRLCESEKEQERCLDLGIADAVSPAIMRARVGA